MYAKEAEMKLLGKYPNASTLRKLHPEISDLLLGHFSEDPCNVYPQGEGVVVSRRLIQRRAKSPTIGVITPGKYEFGTGENTETMIVLDGCLLAGVSDGPISTLQKYGSIIAPAWSKLKLATLEDVFYLCQYKPKK
ncbi:DUF1255 family protein [Candidatus Woesearchaeota archaeon]|nr:DUF1255 family protein [Candidatus Woesearchaeota archaeon]